MPCSDYTAAEVAQMGANSAQRASDNNKKKLDVLTAEVDKLREIVLQLADGKDVELPPEYIKQLEKRQKRQWADGTASGTILSNLWGRRKRWTDGSAQGSILQNLY